MFNAAAGAAGAGSTIAGSTIAADVGAAGAFAAGPVEPVDLGAVEDSFSVVGPSEATELVAKSVSPTDPSMEARRASGLRKRSKEDVGSSCGVSWVDFPPDASDMDEAAGVRVSAGTWAMARIEPRAETWFGEPVTLGEVAFSTSLSPFENGPAVLGAATTADAGKTGKTGPMNAAEVAGPANPEGSVRGDRSRENAASDVKLASAGTPRTSRAGAAPDPDAMGTTSFCGSE